MPSSLPLLIPEQEVWAPTFCPNTLSLLKANLFLVLLPPLPHSLKKCHSSWGSIPGPPFHSGSNLSTTGTTAPHPLGRREVWTTPRLTPRWEQAWTHSAVSCYPGPLHSLPACSHSSPGHALFPEPEKEPLGPRASQTSLNTFSQPQQIHLLGGIHWWLAFVKFLLR